MAAADLYAQIAAIDLSWSVFVPIALKARRQAHFALCHLCQLHNLSPGGTDPSRPPPAESVAPTAAASQATGQIFAAHAFGSFLFDGVHYASHAVSRSWSLARWHNYHHKFQDTHRKIQPRSGAVGWVVDGWVALEPERGYGRGVNRSLSRLKSSSRVGKRGWAPAIPRHPTAPDPARGPTPASRRTT